MHPFVYLLFWIVLIFAITFGIVLPLMLWNKPFSFYFHLDSKEIEQIIEKENAERIENAVSLMNSDSEKALHFYQRRLESENLHILITIVTTDRSQYEKKKLQYVTQTAIYTHQEILKHIEVNVALMICNVDLNPKEYIEVTNLSLYFPSFVKDEVSDEELFEKEKLDYSFCLKQSESLNPNYVLILEDDSLPVNNMLYYLQYIIQYKLTKTFTKGELTDNALEWLAVKLYYPERWMGFANELNRILQLIAFGLLSTWFFVFVSNFLKLYYYVRKNTTVLHVLMVIGFVYGILLALAVGRQNILEFCRLHPAFIQVIKAPGCCTPATLYPTQRIKGLVEFLNGVQCSPKYGLDLAIDDYAKKSNLTILQTEPNLFKHIGFHSSVKYGHKEYTEEFLQ